jgi:site-specific DNA recombinase
MTARSAKPITKRCALYTRKSSEEGLEQDFNSLDAQREACAAYVISQKAEGWKALATVYDDGGYSGGSMERPALQRLLADIQADKIDVIVVYKIDRLTRSLADFARMVELFEGHQVSFVSVTQSFNTTTSMGRLTLNVLLSFAQFEREVTGERIRDKIAASKAKGMWMGGNLPLGYDAPAAGTRALVVNAAEAETVRSIFVRYLKLGSVHALERALSEEGIRSKLHITLKGRQKGGVCFSRGALFHLLRNRHYLGEIVHREQSHPGLHPAIIDWDLFEAVQAQLDTQIRRSKRSEGGKAHSPLTGRIYDGDGEPMTPAFAYGRGGKLYRYYVSVSLQQGARQCTDDALPRRVSAASIETFLSQRLLALLPKPSNRLPSAPGQPLDIALRVEIHSGHIEVTLPVRMQSELEARLGPGEVATRDDCDSANLRLKLPFRVSTRAGKTELIAGHKNGPNTNPALIRALRAAHALVGRDSVGQPIVTTAPSSTYQRRLICLAFLAPDIQDAILAGNQPPDLCLDDLMDHCLPALWSEQRRVLGWPANA